jgi:hypothetical protein
MRIESFKIKYSFFFDLTVTIVIIVMVASIPALSQVGDLRTFIPAIRILYQAILSIPPSRHCPRGYPSAVIGRPARNVSSRTVLHLGGLSIALHLRRSYRITMR